MNALITEMSSQRSIANRKRTETNALPLSQPTDASRIMVQTLRCLNYSSRFLCWIPGNHHQGFGSQIGCALKSTAIIEQALLNHCMRILEAAVQGLSDSMQVLIGAHIGFSQQQLWKIVTGFTAPERW
jgi:hypothetical protein